MWAGSEEKGLPVGPQWPWEHLEEVWNMWTLTWDPFWEKYVFAKKLAMVKVYTQEHLSLAMWQNPLEGLLKHRFLDPTPECLM